MKAMILAAGLGTRLRPLTDNLPKALIRLNGQTLLQWQIERLKRVGIDDITINIHHKAQQVMVYLCQNDNFGCNIRLSYEQDRPLNTGGGILNAFKNNLPDEPIMVLNVDIISNANLTKFVDFSDEMSEKHLAAVLLVSQRETSRYLLFDDTMQLRAWTNIQTHEMKYAMSKTSSNCANFRKLAFSGIQIIQPSLFSETDVVIKSKGADFSVIDWYLSLQKHCVIGYEQTDLTMVDAGKIDQLPLAADFMKRLM